MMAGGETNDVSTKPTQFTVSPGTPGQQIGRELAQANLIRSADAWKLWFGGNKNKNPKGGFKAGTYLISPQDSLNTIAEKNLAGRVNANYLHYP